MQVNHSFTMMRHHDFTARSHFPRTVGGTERCCRGDDIAVL